VSWRPPLRHRRAPGHALCRAAVLGLTLALVVSAVGAAPPESPPEKPAARTAHPADPWEPLNRSVHAFNEGVDEAVLKPVAGVYRQVLPELVQRGVENVFGNVTDLWSAANHLLQGKPEPAAEMTMRVVINTWLGLGGLLDVASEAGLHRQPEDFGQTLGRWGLGPGPYVVLPLFGPRTLRDAAAMPLDWRVSLPALPQEAHHRFMLSGLDAVQTRSGLLGATQLIDQVAIDKYSFVRDSHLARRRSLVYDGDPPPEREDTGDDAPR
jgi:phospholipid-binding lipoprotein MlaA